LVKTGAQRGAMAGVGLIEVLITLVIIAGGVMAMGRLQGLLLTSAASSRQLSDASFMVQREIENLRSRNWDHASLNAGTSAATQVAGTTATYSVQYTVTDTGAAGQMQYKTVQVTVSWTDAQAQVRTYTASTRLQRIGADFSARLLS
jgi:Tfp pilus assembly protein PilV